MSRSKILRAREEVTGGLPTRLASLHTGFASALAAKTITELDDSPNHIVRKTAAWAIEHPKPVW